MKPAPFQWHGPDDVAAVGSLLAEHGSDAKVLAGGQSLVPLLAMRLTARPIWWTSTGCRRWTPSASMTTA